MSSTGAFDQLALPVQKWIRTKGWRELRDIQSQSIRKILEGDNDLIIAAATAGGKTEAAFLPLISRILHLPQPPVGGFDVLYVAPLKALISDQSERLEDICRDMEISVVPWHGDISSARKARAIKHPEGILLITPESLEAMILKRGLDIARLFGRTQVIVIDELHNMLDSERGVQLLSLITRLQLKIGHRMRRIGLSATIGDMNLARRFLNTDYPSSVDLVADSGGHSELQLQVRGYAASTGNDDGVDVRTQISEHLLKVLRGRSNLIFAGSRKSVEFYADSLRTLCEDQNLPQEFFPHHSSLSADHRNFVENRLRAGRVPTTAVCTSTLELGIDIGDIDTVAQIGAPYSVAALRQRLGRSGRRPGQITTLRQYIVESQLNARSNPVDGLRLSLIRTVAMIELLLEGWCEPPQAEALHLSTLVHQILSVIGEYAGASAKRIYRILCEVGPFRTVSVTLFMDVLRAMGREDVGLLEQSTDGLLLPGRVGERVVDHYSFFAVFQTPEEYRIVAEGKTLGTMPIDNVVAPGHLLIFSGRRWTILSVDDRQRIVVVAPSSGGRPPSFGGDPGVVHDRVVEKMFSILEGEAVPLYLDSTAATLLQEARLQYSQFGFSSSRWLHAGASNSLIATRSGTVRTFTLALALRAVGLRVDTYDGFIDIHGDSTPGLRAALRELAEDKVPKLLSKEMNLIFEKFHPYLSRPLLEQDALSSRIDIKALPGLSAAILSHLN